MSGSAWPDAIRTWNSRLFVLGTHWRDFLERARAAATEDAVVLDAGAGSCPYKGLFAGCRRYIAIDLASINPHVERAKLDVVADLSSLPIRDGSVDVVVCTQVLEHTLDPRLVIAELHRVLRSGGQAFISVPFIWNEHMGEWDFFRFSKHGLRHLLSTAGFEIQFMWPMGGFFSVGRWMWDELWADGRLARLPVLKQVTAPLRWLLRAFGRRVLAPICYALDRLDRRETFTLGYFCHACRR